MTSIVLKIDLGTNKDEAKYVARRVSEILDDAVARGAAFMVDPHAIKRVADKFGDCCTALAEGTEDEDQEDS